MFPLAESRAGHPVPRNGRDSFDVARAIEWNRQTDLPGRLLHQEGKPRDGPSRGDTNLSTTQTKAQKPEAGIPFGSKSGEAPETQWRKAHMMHVEKKKKCAWKAPPPSPKPRDWPSTGHEQGQWMPFGPLYFFGPAPCKRHELFIRAQPVLHLKGKTGSGTFVLKLFIMQ